MTRRSKDNPRQDSEIRSRHYMTLVLVALTALVIALTVYVGLRKPTPPARRPATSLADDVLVRAGALMQVGQYRQARDLMQAYVRSTPDDIRVRPLLARAQLELDETGPAERTVDSLLRLAPRSAHGLWLKGHITRLRGGKDYMDFFSRAAASPDADAEINALYGLALLAAGENADARRHLRKALDAGLRDGRTLGGLGRIALDADQFDEAEKLLAEAVKLDRRDPLLWADLASAQKNAGRFDAAGDTLQQALDHCRQKGILLMELGRVRQLQKRPAEAAEAFAAASAYQPNRAEAAFHAARCYYLVGRHALAMQYIDLAAEVRPDNVEIQNWKKKIEDARFGPPQ